MPDWRWSGNTWQYLKGLGIGSGINHKFPAGIGGIANSDILKPCLGLLVQGQNNFDVIEEFRGDNSFLSL
jgi:hypothetical protein